MRKHTHTQALSLNSLSEQKGKGSRKSHWKDLEQKWEANKKAEAVVGEVGRIIPMLRAEVEAQEVNFNILLLSPLA